MEPCVSTVINGDSGKYFMNGKPTETLLHGW